VQVEERSASRIDEKYPTWVPWTVLIIGTVAASASAILVKYADEADPLAISFWRCFVGAAVLVPFARPKLRGLQGRHTRPALIAGALLAIHFATWITSIELTSVAIAVLLVSTAPIFVAVAARYVTHERLNRVGWIGIALAMAGTVIIGGSDFAGSSIGGSLLALIGGATGGWYVLAGQVARRDLGLLEYAVITYSFAAVLLLPFCLATGAELWGYGAQTWWAIAGMIVGPQLLGHTLINYVLSDIDATSVSVTIMAEPVIAMALAYILFEEVPRAIVYPAAVLILGGIYLVSTARRGAPDGSRLVSLE
jgi:drug/metabolite transporter (DMT)-like permease